MSANTITRQVLGGVVAFMLLWFTTISVFVVDVVTEDYTKVFIYDGCLNNGTVTVFIYCLLEVIVGCWFLERFGLPAIFVERWDTFDVLKQQKLVGFIAQIIVRGACCAQLLTILCGGWGRQLTLAGGLFEQHNAKAAYAALLANGTTTTCAKSGMDHLDVAAMRSWTFCKYHMVAVHIWELAFIPQLTIDGWLHHVFVVLVAAISCQPQTFTGDSHIQPLVDLIGFSFILGASMNFLVKACVVMYHYSAPQALIQARWMEASIAGAWFILLIFYAGFPGFVAIYHVEVFGTARSALLLMPIAFLSFVELRLILVKRSIARNARKKNNPNPILEELSLEDRQPSDTSVSRRVFPPQVIVSPPPQINVIPLSCPNLLSPDDVVSRRHSEASLGRRVLPPSCPHPSSPDGNRSRAGSFSVGIGSVFDAERLDTMSDEWKESQC